MRFRTRINELASRKTQLFGAAILLALLVGPAFGQDSSAPPPSTGDTAWLLTAAALVMLMTVPGLALFYGGLVSQRNVLSMLMQSFFLLCLVSVQWVLWGYSLSFGADKAGLIGGLDYIGFGGVGQTPAAGSTVPHLAFAMYQGMFAAITVALITGAFAERMRFPAFIIFSLLWATIIYDPLAHWVWGGGWLMRKGVLDFAGGTVVHISSGVSALVAAILIGRRHGFPEKTLPPHNVTMTVMGAALLWFGWFGFNAGSALGASGLAAIAFAVTNTAAASAGLAWVFIEWAHKGKPTVLGLVTGAVAGLVAITPASGYVGVGASIVIGAGASAVCYLGVNRMKARFGYDDSLDVFGVHGLGGTWGAIATGIFASKSINPAGADGLIHGRPQQLVTQATGVLAAWLVAGIGTFLVLNLVKLLTPLRVTREDEITGLDLAVHGEEAYNLLGPGMSGIATSGQLGTPRLADAWDRAEQAGSSPPHA